jgi:ParB-like chromosome segregation protein Spo0J
MTRFDLVPTGALLPHEAFDPERGREVLDGMRARRTFYPPVLVDDETLVILDGHHRWWAGQRLGCVLTPCYRVDYLDDDGIHVRARRANIPVSKRAVIEMGAGHTVFPPKTTRHVYILPDWVRAVPIDDLIP